MSRVQTTMSRILLKNNDASLPRHQAPLHPSYRLTRVPTMQSAQYFAPPPIPGCMPMSSFQCNWDHLGFSRLITSCGCDSSVLTKQQNTKGLPKSRTDDVFQGFIGILGLSMNQTRIVVLLPLGWCFVRSGSRLLYPNPFSMFISCQSRLYE